MIPAELPARARAGVRRLRELRYGYHLARLHSRLAKEYYERRLPALAARPLPQRPPVDAAVFAFSGEHDVAEQVASIRSFLTWVGVPRRFTVVSDGSHSPRSRRALQAIHPVVDTVDFREFVRPDAVPARVMRLAQRDPMAKKLAVELSLPFDGATLYTDSDVLFFARGERLAEVLARPGGARYLLDCHPTLDPRLLERAPGGRATVRSPVNAGFWLSDRPLPWEAALEALERCFGEPTFRFQGITEQTVVHLALHAAGARPLDPATFVLEVDDHFNYRSNYREDAMALRHFVKGTRHLLWLGSLV